MGGGEGRRARTDTRAARTVFSCRAEQMRGEREGRWRRQERAHRRAWRERGAGNERCTHAHTQAAATASDGDDDDDEHRSRAATVAATAATVPLTVLCLSLTLSPFLPLPFSVVGLRRQPRQSPLLPHLDWRRQQKQQQQRRRRQLMQAQDKSAGKDQRESESEGRVQRQSRQEQRRERESTAESQISVTTCAVCLVRE